MRQLDNYTTHTSERFSSYFLEGFREQLLFKWFLFSSGTTRNLRGNFNFDKETLVIHTTIYLLRQSLLFHVSTESPAHPTRTSSPPPPPTVGRSLHVKSEWRGTEPNQKRIRQLTNAQAASIPQMFTVLQSGTLLSPHIKLNFSHCNCN